ncbi:glycosyltransferase family 39 protein [Leptospira ognonensis]|uniref:Glycosyltransferase family 39 protein n=1 Tax=Leptospira ognonensis TaxID=2484945 RepID=A0A4R9K919_9LEPT|nr:glycosyltransferase family 39 protein [Leptospira ognonensis]TGL61208.1 glycosyltransferase family 39 protein [Leptospira ognonensis]
MKLLSKIPRIYLLTALFFLFLLSFNDSPLYDQDEAAYAGFAKQMLITGDFVKQEFPFSEPHRKPPLHLWVTASAFHLFGISEFSLRIFPSLWLALTCLLTFQIAKHLFNQSVGEVSFLILATSLYFPLNGKIGLVDGLLTFTETLGLFALVQLLIPKSKSSIYWVILFWIAICLGALTKGPPIFIFLGGICFLCLFHKQTRANVLQLRPWLFLPLAIVPLVYWGYLAWQRTNGEMIRWMIDWYILRRASDSVFGQSGPPGTYFLLYFVTLLPWSIYLPSVLKAIFRYLVQIKDSFRKKSESISVEGLILVSGLFFGWVFFEFLMSKLPSYTLAAYPLLSILIAKSYTDASSEFLKKTVLAFAILLTVALHLFVSPLVNTYRMDSKIVATKWNRSIPNQEPFYSLKNYALPSFAFYLDHPIIVMKDIQDFKILPNRSYLLIDPEMFMILTNFGLKAEIIAEEESIFAYDRNKTISLLIIQIKNESSLAK